LLDRGVEVVTRLRRRLGVTPVIMGCGGITTVADAQRYLDAGATLVQGYTGLIYQGPFWGSRINRGLLRSRRA
jgi:dihydroorotate dehydrogenase